MNKQIAALLVSVLCLFLMSSCDNENDAYSTRYIGSVKKAKACTSENAKAIAYAYYYSSPIIDSSKLVNFIERNKSFFVEDGGGTRCGASLGKALIYQGLQTFDQRDYDRAYERTLAAGGTMEMAHDVGSSMQSGSLDAYMMGQELVWLAQVLPSAANGNWNPYRTTGTQTRNQLRQILPIYQMLRHMDPGVARIVDTVMGQYEQIAIQQIQMLAIMFDN